MAACVECKRDQQDPVFCPDGPDVRVPWPQWRGPRKVCQPGGGYVWLCADCWPMSLAEAEGRRRAVAMAAARRGR